MTSNEGGEPVATANDERKQLENWVERPTEAIHLHPKEKLLQAISASQDSKRKLVAAGVGKWASPALTVLFNHWLGGERKDLDELDSLHGKTVQNILNSHPKKGVTYKSSFVLFLFDEFGLRPSQILRDFTADRVALWLEKHPEVFERLGAVLDEERSPLSQLEGTSSVAKADALRGVSIYDLAVAVWLCAFDDDTGTIASDVSELLWLLMPECGDHLDEVTLVRAAEKSKELVYLKTHEAAVAEFINAAADRGRGRSARRRIQLELDQDGERPVGRAALCPSRADVEGWGLRQLPATGMNPAGFGDLLELHVRSTLLELFNQSLGGRETPQTDWSELQVSWDLRGREDGTRPYVLLRDIEGLEAAVKAAMPRIAAVVSRVQVLAGCGAERRAREQLFRQSLVKLLRRVEQVRRS